LGHATHRDVRRIHFAAITRSFRRRERQICRDGEGTRKRICRALKSEGHFWARITFSDCGWIEKSRKERDADYRLVTLSVIIAIFASYAALELAGRVTAAPELCSGGLAPRRRVCHGNRHLVHALHRNARIPLAHSCLLSHPDRGSIFAGRNLRILYCFICGKPSATHYFSNSHWKLADEARRHAPLSSRLVDFIRSARGVGLLIVWSFVET